MARFKKHQQGVTLLETILVLAIAATILALGVRVYNQFLFQINEQKIAANVNQLFQALNGFFYANCRATLNSSSEQLSTGTLDPLNTDTSGTPKSNLVLSVYTDLITPGFINSANWNPDNPLLDNTTGYFGYYIQFNRVLSDGEDNVMSVNACSGSNNPPSCDKITNAVLTDANQPTPTQQSHVVIWVAQVAVKLSENLSAAQIIQIKNDLNADCVSTLWGSGVAACLTIVGTPDRYLVWARPPSAYNPNITSDYWTATPYVKEFNMQYTNDGMAALTGVTNETQNWYNPLNYLCGG